MPFSTEICGQVEERSPSVKSPDSLKDKKIKKREIRSREVSPKLKPEVSTKETENPSEDNEVQKIVYTISKLPKEEENEASHSSPLRSETQYAQKQVTPIKLKLTMSSRPPAQDASDHHSLSTPSIKLQK